MLTPERLVRVLAQCDLCGEEDVEQEAEAPILRAALAELRSCGWRWNRNHTNVRCPDCVYTAQIDS